MRTGHPTVSSAAGGDRGVMGQSASHRSGEFIFCFRSTRGGGARLSRFSFPCRDVTAGEKRETERFPPKIDRPRSTPTTKRLDKIRVIGEKLTREIIRSPIPQPRGLAYGRVSVRRNNFTFGRLNKICKKKKKNVRQNENCHFKC